jgi:hypothetical protein
MRLRDGVTVRAWKGQPVPENEWYRQIFESIHWIHVNLDKHHVAQRLQIALPVWSSSKGDAPRLLRIVEDFRACGSRTTAPPTGMHQTLTGSGRGDSLADSSR